MHVTVIGAGYVGLTTAMALAYLGHHVTCVDIDQAKIARLSAVERRFGCEREPDFVVASNPEFLREGSAMHDALYPDRIVIGVEDERTVNVLSELYRPLLDQSFTPPPFLPRPAGLAAVPLVTADLASAELIKYAANAFLALEVSFINDSPAVAITRELVLRGAKVRVHDPVALHRAEVELDDLSLMIHEAGFRYVGMGRGDVLGRPIVPAALDHVRSVA